MKWIESPRRGGTKDVFTQLRGVLDWVRVVGDGPLTPEIYKNWLKIRKLRRKERITCNENRGSNDGAWKKKAKDCWWKVKKRQGKGAKLRGLDFISTSSGVSEERERGRTTVHYIEYNAGGALGLGSAVSVYSKRG